MKHNNILKQTLFTNCLLTLKKNVGSTVNVVISHSFHSTFNWNFVAFVVQSLSHVWFFATPWTTACQAPLSFTLSWHLLEFMSIEMVMLSTCLHSLLTPYSFAINLSQHQGVSQWVGFSYQMAKVLAFSMSYIWHIITEKYSYLLKYVLPLILLNEHS